MARENITGKLMMDLNDKSALVVERAGLLKICLHASMAAVSRGEDAPRGATPARPPPPGYIQSQPPVLLLVFTMSLSNKIFHFLCIQGLVICFLKRLIMINIE